MSAELKNLNLTKCLLALCLSTTVLTAWAQDADEEEDALELDRVVVTGSLLKREDFTSSAPMQVIDAETQFQAGQLSVADMLQNTTIAAGTTQLNTSFNGFVIEGGTGVQTINLRGLGASRTLTLLNGRRPGGSGTRGQVNALDLGMIPEVALQRAEILTGGNSSIYGSDAVAGVVNLITRRSVDRTEATAFTEIPIDGGGELYQASVITGFNTAKGAFTLSAQYSKREELTVGDRDFLNCFQDRVTDSTGARIDRIDASITAGTPLGGCNNLYANTVIDAFTGLRYIPSPDGVTIGPIPGYRPRTNSGVAPDAFYEDVLNFDFLDSESARAELERMSIYATADYDFDFWGGVSWDMDFLYSNRQSAANGWRQFFPLIGSSRFRPYPNDPSYDNGFAASQPVYPYPSNSEQDVDFFYVTTGLEGVFPTERFWSWQTYVSYSRSDGDYTNNGILQSLSADTSISTGFDAPGWDVLDPSILNGSNRQALIDAIGITETGNTVYDQLQWTGIITGDLLDLPAGTLATAIGLEYREFSIDDVPPPASRNGDLWGQSSAVETTGENDVIEAFVEAEIPLIANMPLIESLTLNASARAFDYDKGGDDVVWKAGLNWNITPTFMLRGTAGTSYRAPALFEQFLGNQTGFVGQTGIDPCIDWGESTNDNVRANCAAEGIPSDYTGVPGSSALVISGGGVDNLEAETSDAYTVGFVWTPEFADLSVAVDYFDFEINNQISQLGASNIVGGCYLGDNFPNSFCDLFTRAPGDDPSNPYNVLTVNDSYVNVNQQRTSGIDATIVWRQDFDFGQIGIEANSTWTFENVQRLFDLGSVEGFDETDFAGTFGSPENVTNIRFNYNKNDWGVTWFIQHFSETDSRQFANEEFTYFGNPDARRDIVLDAQTRHNLSVIYTQEDWDFLLGVNNVLDEEPDVVSTGSGFSVPRGNVPLAATQYDLLGRRVFARLNFRF
jgi:iron complex outermembrane receptor protein